MNLSLHSQQLRGWEGEHYLHLMMDVNLTLYIRHTQLNFRIFYFLQGFLNQTQVSFFRLFYWLDELFNILLTRLHPVEDNLCRQLTRHKTKFI